MVDTNEFLSKLSQNLLEILDGDEEYHDITIEVGDDPYVKIFRAHMVILNYRSPYLKRILSTNKKKNDGTMTHIKLSNILPETFQIILRYIYGGKIPLHMYDAPDIIKILIAASELSLQELVLHLQSFLIKTKSEWIEQNLDLVYQMSFKNDTFIELQKFCISLISREPEKFFDSPDFTSISEKSLISLIRSDFQMDEIQIWKHVLKWGFAQNPKLSSDNLENLSNDDFDALKTTLQQCIPFIEFHNLTSREFSDSIIPYKKILPKELYKDLLKDFLNNDNRPIDRPKSRIAKNSRRNIDSIIITDQHAELISKWIDGLEITDRVKNLYEFKLILRGSRDGFDPEKFHELCDYKPHTVSIIKVKGSNEILGGYSPIEWKTTSLWSILFYGAAMNSFIFSFMDRKNINDYILSRVKDVRHAIYYWSECGPAFGISDLRIHGSSDFYSNNTSYCEKKSYEKPIRKTDDKFSIEEYEIFQIMNVDV